MNTAIEKQKRSMIADNSTEWNTNSMSTDSLNTEAVVTQTSSNDEMMKVNGTVGEFLQADGEPDVQTDREILMSNGDQMTKSKVTAHALADEPLAKVEGEMSDDLRELIYDVMGEAEDPATSVAQARRRLKAAGKAADSVMRSQGYYSAIIDRKVIEAAADEPSDIAAAPQAVLIIKTGKQFKYGTIGLELSDRLIGLEREISIN